MHGVGAADGGGAGFRQAEMADLAGADEVGDRAGHVLDRHGGVDAVLVEQVDAVGAEARQRGFHHLADVVRVAVELGRADAEAELGGDHDLVADGGKGFAHQLLVDVGAVDLGGVEEGDALVDGTPQEGDHVLARRRRAVGEAHAHAAEAEGGDLEAGGAELALLHGCFLVGRRPASHADGVLRRGPGPAPTRMSRRGRTTRRPSMTCCRDWLAAIR